MNKLNTSIYLALNNYKESYEFYKSHPEKPRYPKLKIIQGLADYDRKMAA